MGTQEKPLIIIGVTDTTGNMITLRKLLREDRYEHG